ncbi:unnamed protein product [Parnassius apollo]|uniref:(apollo) hypothetical protein n=1 Tax=Parnassius apollo TaxID=110799 RepID=A0A8S3XDI9_PARAO|nr:unnamed protein product [Parnassius apollo]
MERNLFAPEKSRVLPTYNQMSKDKRGPSTAGVVPGASGAEPPTNTEPARQPRRNIASRKRTPPKIEEEDLQEEKRLKTTSGTIPESTSASSPTHTSENTHTPPQKQPVTRHNSPPESPSPTTSPTCMHYELQDLGEQDPKENEPQRAQQPQQPQQQQQLQRQQLPTPTYAPTVAITGATLAVPANNPIERTERPKKKRKGRKKKKKTTTLDVVTEGTSIPLPFPPPPPPRSNGHSSRAKRPSPPRRRECKPPATTTNPENHSKEGQ